MKKLTTEEFIRKAKVVHGDKYNYSKVDYKTSREKICIICPEHGEFYQKVNNHLNGYGCLKCGGRIISTTEQFIEKAKLIHDNKYDYLKVNYINNKKKVCIICLIHGEFYQTPNSHLEGAGCQKCYGNDKSETDIFVKKSITIHGDKFSYSKVKYTNSRTKVCIICKDHGEFYQTPYNHLNGCSCPICNESKLEKETAQLLDENNIIYERQKRFSWLGRQSLDFYLPYYNIGIECQGRQHFEPVDYFGGDKGLIKTIERDVNKINKCVKNGIKTIYYCNLNRYDRLNGHELLNKNNLLQKIQEYGKHT